MKTKFFNAAARRQKAARAWRKASMIALGHWGFTALLGSFLFLPPVSFAQHVIPPYWQQSNQDYADSSWIRDKDSNHVDDTIDKLADSALVDIVVDLRRYMAQDLLRSKYRAYMARTPGESRDLSISNFINCVFVPSVRVDTVKNVIVKQPEVFLIEFAGVAKINSDTALASIRVASSPRFQGTTIRDKFPHIDGRGISIAILDTGVDSTFERNNVTMVVGFRDFTAPNPASNPANNASKHGTMMASIILGKGMSPNFPGVAPGAHLIDVKAGFQHDQFGTFNIGGKDFGKIMQALEWIIESKKAKIINTKIINMSFSLLDPITSKPLYSDGNDAFSNLVNYAVSQGIVCVASAGDYAEDQFSAGRITAPGAASRAITVGAYNDKGTVDRNDDEWANFSSFGPLRAGSPSLLNIRKPELVAPGFAIRCSTNSRIFFNGTSFAAAYVSGLAALILQYKPEMTPDGVKALLMESAEKRGALPGSRLIDWNEKVGYGYVDAWAAFARLDTNRITDITFNSYPDTVHDAHNHPSHGYTWDFRNDIQWDKSNHEIKVKLKNVGPRNATTNIYVDVGMHTGGINPIDYPYVGTGRLASLDNGRSGEVVITNVPVFTQLSMAIRATIRYGQDKDYRNNTAVRNVIEIGGEANVAVAPVVTIADMMPLKSRVDTVTLSYKIPVYTDSPTPVNLRIENKCAIPEIFAQFTPSEFVVDRSKPPVNVEARVKAKKDDLKKYAKDGYLHCVVVKQGDSTSYGEVLTGLEFLENPFIREKYVGIFIVGLLLGYLLARVFEKIRRRAQPNF